MEFITDRYKNEFWPNFAGFRLKTHKLLKAEGKPRWVAYQVSDAGGNLSAMHIKKAQRRTS